MTEPPICPVHGKPALIVFVCCRGATGGKAVSPAKAASARENMTKAREAKALRPPPSTAPPGHTGSPAPDPRTG